jgi:galactose mutarotase-like enzyme
MTAEPALLKLSTGRTEVSIAPHRGAIVTSFRVADRELLYFDEATFNDPSKNIRGGIPILFPTPGKLDNDRWSYAGAAGELQQHGFARNASWQVATTSAASAMLVLESSRETLANYPWSFESRLTYSVMPDALRIEFQVTNSGQEAMPFAFGLHPYFAVRDKAAARIPTRATHAFNNVTKQMASFAGFDLTQDEVDLHLIDHRSTHAELQLGDGAGIAIDTSPEFIRWIVWTVVGKDYVCLEPWTAPGNALNSREGLIVLAPHETRALWTQISFTPTAR